MAGYWLNPLFWRLWRLPQIQVPLESKDAGALRVGMLGASFIGKVAVVYAAGKRRDVVVAAVASRDAARARSFAESAGVPRHFGGPRAYDDLLALEGLDAVYISVPTGLHVRWAKAALAAGRHVLLEKPAALSASEVAELRRAAVASGRLLVEAAHYQHHPAALQLRALAREGKLGQLLQVDAEFAMLDPKAWLHSALGLGAAGAAERAHERVKNFDRWWYCADELLWLTGATSWTVLSATERRFSVDAELLLDMPGEPGTAARQVRATLSMSRDRLLPPFAWNLRARGAAGAASLTNVGFPFLYHSLGVTLAGGESREEQHYGAGETTFEHQLSAFAAAVRAEAAVPPLDGAERTFALVGDILAAAGSEPMTSA